MLSINETSIIGAQFQVSGNVLWTCIGYASNDTFLVVGSTFDSVNNRSTIRTFKFQDVQFIGILPNPVVK